MTGGTGLRITHEWHDGAIVATPVGALELGSYPLLRDALLKYAAEAPTGLVVDLGAMTAACVTSLSVFPTVWFRISSWPGIPLLLAAARHQLVPMLAASAVPRFVPVHLSVATGLAALGQTPERRRAQTMLPCVSASAAAARAWVTRICTGWEVPADDALLLVASELVTNSICHTASRELTLRLELHGAGLAVAVSDADPRPPVLIPFSAATTMGGRGIALVDALSRAWGHGPRLDGGKIVWAVLPVPGGPTAPLGPSGPVDPSPAGTSPAGTDPEPDPG